MELSLECALMSLLGVANRIEFTSDYLLQLTIITCSYASMEKMFLSCVSCPPHVIYLVIGYFTLVALLIPPEYKIVQCAT